MFDYTKEVIINSNVTDEGLTKISADGNVLKILRIANYDKNNLASKVYKTLPVAGQMPQYKLVFASTLPENLAGVYRFSLDITMAGKYMSDYADAVWNYQKPVIVEVEFAANMTDEARAERVYKAFQLATPENYKFIRVVLESDNKTVTITGTDSHQIFKSLTVERFVPNELIPSEGDYVPADATYVTVTKAQDNIQEFGTANWITENLRFPSYPNVRYNAVNADELPVPGGMYTQYAFKYKVPRQHAGIGTVGQELVSITTHVFYVLSTVVDAFETALKTAFGSDVILQDYSIEIISAASITEGGEAVALKANLYPVKEGAVVNWEIVDNPDSTHITLSGGNSLQVTSGTTTEEITVKATCEGYTPATQLIDIIQDS